MAAPGDDLFEAAIECFQAGRLDDAERNFKALLGRQPQHVGALNILGVLLASRHRYAEAEPHLRAASSLSPNSDATHYNYGIVLKGLGRPAEALEHFSKALALNPSVADTWNNRGTVHNDLKRYEQAVQDFDRAIALLPRHYEAFYNKGNALQQLKRHDEARVAYERALALKPDMVEAWLGRGNALKALRRHDEALAAYDRALALKPDLEAWLGRGHALLGLNRAVEASDAYDKALTLTPDPVPVWLRRGDSLTEFKRYGEAAAAFDKALALKPDLAAGWLGRGNILFHLNRNDEALAAYNKAIACNPTLAEAWLGRGNVSLELRRDQEALAAYDRALQLMPDLNAAALGRGHVFANLRRYSEALAIYEQINAVQPDLAEAWIGRGNVFSNLKGYDQALAAYDQAIAFKPDLADAWLGRGNVLKEGRRYDEALAAYDRAFVLKPDLKYVEGYRLYTKQLICDWRNLEPEWRHLLAAVGNGRPAADPLTILMGPSSAAEQLKCAQLYTAEICPLPVERLWRDESYSHDRIRLAYMSADFRDHALAHLLASMFEQHDRARFETIAISLGPDDQSEMRARLKRAFDRFIDVNTLGNKEAAHLIRELEVDILVDLTGFTSGSRSEILAFRPAPIQVNYLYPGMTNHIDYVLGDRFVIPEDHLVLFPQPVVYLPDTYFGYDTKQQISDRASTRTEHGLPETGFVFCAFNNTYKILPPVFDTWMRLLRAIPGSALWLSATNAAAVSNLRREARAREVDPDRLCFAPYVKDMADHLARYRLADLFLDAWPFGAHTTALDALWAGLPVLTCLGSTFVGRVAAGLLSAVRLPELIAHSPAEYEAQAMTLATDAPLLAAIRRKLADQRLTTPLFDAALFTKRIEAAYDAIIDRHRSGLPPDHIAIAP